MRCSKCGTNMTQSKGDQYGFQYDCPKCGHSVYQGPPSAGPDYSSYDD